MPKVNKGFILILIAIILFFNPGRPAQSLEATEALEEILKTAGAQATRGEIQYYALLEKRYLSVEELKDILLAVAEHLALENAEVSTGAGETFRVVDTAGITARGSEVQIIVQSNPPDEGSDAETYLLVILGDTAVERVKSAAARIKADLNSLAPDGRISYYLAGEIAEKLSPEQMAGLAASALAAVDGKIVESMENEELVSYTAYSPRINDHVDLAGKKFNLNLAVRYDNHRQKTVLWAGFPLLHTTY